MGDIIHNRNKFIKGWIGGLPETPCGKGSTLSETSAQRLWIPEIIKKYNIRTIADIGAGDLNWISHIDLTGIEYTAYDLIPRSENIIQFDILEDIAPFVDMIMCFWVLNHFPIDQARRALSHIIASGSKYLMMTDRPRWHHEQPEEIHMPAIEQLMLNDKQDSIKLIKL